MEIDRLFALSHEAFRELSSADWESTANLLLASLAAELATPLYSTGVILPDEGDVQPGIVLSLRSCQVDSTGLGVRIEGLLGGRSEPEKAVFSASIFIFVGDVRVRGAQADFYELQLEGTSGGVRWRRIGWQEDVYGEFDSVRMLGDISKEN